MVQRGSHVPHTAAYKDRKDDYMRQWREKNADHRKAYMANWREGHKEHERQYREHYKLNRRWLRRYGLTRETWEAMFDAQGGRCAICNYQPKGTSFVDRLVVDHDHETGRVRALLCTHCNRGIGQLHDDPDLLYAASEYLSIHKRPLLSLVS